MKKLKDEEGYFLRYRFEDGKHYPCDDVKIEKPRIDDPHYDKKQAVYQYNQRLIAEYKQEKSVADARAVKADNAVAKRALSRKLYGEMAGLYPNRDIIAEVNLQSKHGNVSDSAFYRYIEGM